MPRKRKPIPQRLNVKKISQFLESDRKHSNPCDGMFVKSVIALIYACSEMNNCRIPISQRREAEYRILKMERIIKTLEKFEKQMKSSNLSEIAEEMHSLPRFLHKNELIFFQIWSYFILLTLVQRNEPMFSIKTVKCFQKCLVYTFSSSFFRLIPTKKLM